MQVFFNYFVSLHNVDLNNIPSEIHVYEKIFFLLLF